MQGRAIAVVMMAVSSAACTGWLSDPLSTSREEGGPAGPSTPGAISLGNSGFRRLTRSELTTTLHMVFGVSPDALLDVMPPDITAERGNPFDNDEALQDVATAYVQGLTTFADRYGMLVAADEARVDALAGCSPAGADDAVCFEAFVRNAARRMFRREIDADDVARFAPLLAYAREANDFYVAIAGVVQALAQHPESVFRFEAGVATAVGGRNVVALDDYAVASRLAFLVWGAGPDAELLDAAMRGELQSPAGRLVHAQRLFDDPLARTHWRRFHAQWLGYDGRTPDVLPADLLLETNTVIDAITHDDQTLAWRDLYRLDRTFVTPALAAHYGLPKPQAPSWVDYDGKRGGGILAHGMFLQQGAKFGDTSPTLRGYRLWKRSFCGDLGAPPIDVDTDNPPSGVSPNACKAERYSMRADPACASCHALTDGIGFGLENFGAAGEWRDHESHNTTCAIDGDGNVLDVVYSGPKELGEILAESDDVAICSARQLFRFAAGRTEAADDEAAIAAIAERMTSTPRFRDVLMALVESNAFIHSNP